ncbi:unnamed protein product [Polarella glacialis]|uniref:V-type proton ATPase subunit n=1 Tax=Polarella glacialis TaxID=89957 RepID=A0A813J6X8_POLGL|nr:unnamed protein product [Polarella glacialis]
MAVEAMAGAACLGFMAPGLVNGVCWLVVGIFANYCAFKYVVKETPKITMEESKSLALVVVWASTICLWLFWSFVYMHQMVPLIYPVHIIQA